MADNFTTKDASSATITGAADEIASVKYPRIKLIHGADGVNDGDVSSANPLPVDVKTSVLPTGAGTSANQTTIIGHLDGVEGLLGTIDTDTGNIATNTSDTASGISDVNTNLGILTETAPASDTASSGLNGRLQRIAQRITSLIALFPTALTGSGNFKTAVSEALPAGTNAIGKLSANSGVDIGDVDVTSTPVVRSILVASTNNTPITTATDTTIITAPTGGQKIRLYYVNASNNHATVATDVMFRDGASGARLWRNPLAPLYGIFAHNLRPHYLDLTANTALVVTTTGAANVHVTVEYEIV
jgi:hypothetical protein